jgi:Zn-dependent protease
MNPDVRLGRIAGVEVAASWSLLVIVGLITWSLGAAVLPGAAPGAPAVAVWVTSAVTAVAFFACLLAHELAHAVVARSAGMKVDGIVLWMFGGVSRLGGDAPDARTEQRVAIAGPRASAGLCIGLLGLAALAGPAGAPDVIVAAVVWLGFVNGLLAAFNLLPAYPLDGGRVVRAIVWRRTGDRRRATTVAATTGVAWGYGLMALGALLALVGDGLGGIWLALLGWIVHNAARAEQAAVERCSLLGTARVGDLMTPDPVTVHADLTVEALIGHYVGLYRCSAFPVVGPDGSPLGLVTLSRLRDVPAHLRATTTMAQVATPIDRVVTAHPREPVVDLLARLTPGTGRRALVLEHDVVVGIVTASDLDRALELAAVGGPAALTTPRRP